ncbi:MAG: KH domain-containing protein, partial [Actinomycetes bacterium]
MIEDALEHLVKGIVDHPDDVSVSNKTTKRANTLEVTVNGEDLG